MQGRQIFQTGSATRWQRFKWGTRVFLFLAAFLITIAAIAYWRQYTPDIPHIRSMALKQNLKDTTSFISQNSKLAKKYGGFRKYFSEKDLRMKPYTLAPSSQNAVFTPKQFPAAFPAGIRSAFYVTWDPQSFFSLQRNVTKLNLVIPEWMFIDPNADTLYVNSDSRAFAVMKQAGVNIMPILSNVYKEKFMGDAVHRIINNTAKRERLINDVINVLQKNHFIGVNVDFEELQESSDEQLINFQRELYQKLHAKGFLVTQDIVPFNNDYNYEQLAKYNDYVFVMAYDEFSEDTKPGPIAEQKWVEAAIDEAAKKIPANKLILSVGAYGYDWPENDQASNLTYQQALITARELNATIDYDNDSYNLNYSYVDDDNIKHTVYFTDAATAFNSVRFATEYNLAGVALWRLGSEDYRIWDFYNKSMTKAALQSFDFNDFTSVSATDDVDWIGNGEIIDIRSTPRSGRITPEVDRSDMLISEESYDSLPSMFVAQKYGWNATDTLRNKKKLVLTFDDGPDPEWTPKILDILSKEHVPATFFVIGLNAENNIPIVKRIYREGHEIGDHTFTHPNIAEVSHRRAIAEMESTRLLLECIT
ncbi:MAG TPA: polysaccharide deacetylase family protein, partial [Flavisolibacter sp.]|nr:polysaccharide deacetylase family protein [Flavisolibacter sp.]